VNPTHDLKIVGSNPVVSKMMEVVNVKAMPGSIPAPNSGTIMEKNKKIYVAKWGKPTKNIKKKNFG
jgi:hypothetical protein